MAYGKLFPNRVRFFFTTFGKQIKNRILAFWEKYITAYGKSVKDGHKSNAFAPLVWFVIFLIVPLIIFALTVKNQIIQYIIIGLIVIVILFTLVIYVVLLNKDPKLLQSESYRLEDRKLDLIAQQGDDNSIEIINPTSITTEIKGQIDDE